MFAALPVVWADAERYSSWKGEARRRMAGRDEEDWPTVALALSFHGARTFAIWTQDNDFEAAGLPTLTTGQLLDALEGRGQ